MAAKKTTHPQKKILPFPEVPEMERGLGDLIKDQEYDRVMSIALRMDAVRFEDKDKATAIKQSIIVLADLCEGIIGSDECVERLKLIVDDTAEAKAQGWYID